MPDRITLLFLCLLSFCACTKDDENPNPNADTATCLDGIQNGLEIGIDCGGDCSLCGPPGAGSFFYGFIDEKEVIISGSNKTVLKTCTAPDFTFHKNGGTWLTNPTNAEFVDAGIILTKGFMVVPNENELYDMFLPGSYEFGDCANGIEGVEIEWFDGASISWRSELGNQTGSSFTITKRGAIVNHSVEIEGNFNCNLYFGNKAKVITSGQFRQVVKLN